MTPRTLLCLGLLLVVGACSGGDAHELTNEGRAALGSGDAKGALAKFDAAIGKMPANDPDYLNAAMGKCEALARIDAKRAQAEFLALAQARPADVKEQDYSRICNALVRAKSWIEAADVMDAGKKRFPESVAMKAIGDEVVAATKKSNDPAALKHLEGLGYGAGGEH